MKNLELISKPRGVKIEIQEYESGKDYNKNEMTEKEKRLVMNAICYGTYIGGDVVTTKSGKLIFVDNPLAIVLGEENYMDGDKVLSEDDLIVTNGLSIGSRLERVKSKICPITNVDVSWKAGAFLCPESLLNEVVSHLSLVYGTEPRLYNSGVDGYTLIHAFHIDQF